MFGVNNADQKETKTSLYVIATGKRKQQSDELSKMLSHESAGRMLHFVIRLASSLCSIR